MKQSKSINFARHFLKYNWVGNKCGKTYLKSTIFILLQQLFQTGGLYQLQKIQILSHKMGTNIKLAASTEFSLGVAPKPSSIPKQRLQQRDYKMWSLVILDYTISFSFYIVIVQIQPMLIFKMIIDFPNTALQITCWEEVACRKNIFS